MLDYFEARQAEKAARTFYEAVLVALAYLEDAGERAKVARLALAVSLQNAAKEAASQRALQARELGEDPNRKQAPPLLLGVLEALERTVWDESLPLLHRACAWYRLLRHWANFASTTLLACRRPQCPGERAASTAS